MKVRIHPSAPGAGDLQHLITFVVEDRLAIDAGCLGLCGTPQEQAAVTSVFLTHSHADHVCSLPFYAMNVVDATGQGATVHAPADVVEVLHQDLFNWRTWPDFTALRQGRFSTSGQKQKEYEKKKPGVVDVHVEDVSLVY